MHRVHSIYLEVAPINIMTVPPLKVFTYVPVTNQILCRSITMDTAETSETGKPKPSPVKSAPKPPETPKKEEDTAKKDDDGEEATCLLVPSLQSSHGSMCVIVTCALRFCKWSPATFRRMKMRAMKRKRVMRPTIL